MNGFEILKLLVYHIVITWFGALIAVFNFKVRLIYNDECHVKIGPVTFFPTYWLSSYQWYTQSKWILSLHYLIQSDPQLFKDMFQVSDINSFYISFPESFTALSYNSFVLNSHISFGYKFPVRVLWVKDCGGSNLTIRAVS